MSLIPHPLQAPGPVEALDVAAGWRDGALTLAYRLRADPSALRLPPASTPRRADGLWRHTCFEAFVCTGDGPGYLEFNFSPSGEWAAYRFDARREGMRPLALAPEPASRVTRLPDGLHLQVGILLPEPCGSPLRLGLAAVIESMNGASGYWALRHGPGAPDFHDPESFTLRVGADGTDERA